MKILRHLFVAAGSLALLAGSPVFAQNTQVTVTAIIPVLMNLTVDTSTVTINFTQGDYLADGTGTKEMVNATTFKVSSNASWILNVAADNVKFTYAPHLPGLPLDPIKSCSDLSLSPSNTATYVPVSTTAAELARGVAGGYNDTGHTIPVSYKLATTLAGDPPGAYTLTLTYTLMSQ